jgi:streptogramin lyase
MMGEFLPEGSNAPFGIAVGPDGNLWFTKLSVNRACAGGGS